MTNRDDAADLYLDLVKRVLTRADFPEPVMVRTTNWSRVAVDPVQSFLTRRGYAVVTLPQVRDSVWGNQLHQGETMIERPRLDHLQRCVETVLEEGVPGDLIETGVWRGGAVVLMRAALAAYGVSDRVVYAADSFVGFPDEASRHDAVDRGVDYTGRLGDRMLAVDLDTVKASFARYGLLDDQVRFLVGWFAETLPTAPIDRLAILHLDGDMYGSTRDALVALYPKLSPGGFCIVDDYYFFDGCRRAVDEYREQHQVLAPIVDIDDQAVYWRAQPTESRPVPSP